MAVLILPTRRGVRPPALTPIDRSHPIWRVGKPLCALNLFSASPYDLTGTTPATSITIAGTVGVTIGNVGPQIANTGSTGLMQIGATGATNLYVGANDFWSVVTFRLVGFVNQGSSINFLVDGASDSSFTTNWGWVTDSTNKLQFTVAQGFPSGTITAATVADGRWHTAVGARIGASSYLWLDGAPSVTSGTIGTLSETAAHQVLLMNGVAANIRGWNGETALFAYGLGTISENIGQMVSANPWQIFLPQRARLWSAPAADVLFAQACL